MRVASRCLPSPSAAGLTSHWPGDRSSRPSEPIRNPGPTARLSVADAATETSISGRSAPSAAPRDAAGGCGMRVTGAAQGPGPRTSERLVEDQPAVASPKPRVASTVAAKLGRATTRSASSFAPAPRSRPAPRGPDRLHGHRPGVGADRDRTGRPEASSDHGPPPVRPGRPALRPAPARVADGPDRKESGSARRASTASAARPTPPAGSAAATPRAWRTSSTEPRPIRRQEPAGSTSAAGPQHAVGIRVSQREQRRVGPVDRGVVESERERSPSSGEPRCPARA